MMEKKEEQGDEQSKWRRGEKMEVKEEKGGKEKKQR